MASFEKWAAAWGEADSTGGMLTSGRDPDQKLDPCELDLTRVEERYPGSVTRE